MNALHRPANLQMQAALDRFAADPGRWIAIITGAGPRAFSAGNDLKNQAAGGDTTQVPCGFGGGFEIALACDLIVAAENAVFALPEPRSGWRGAGRAAAAAAAGSARGRRRRAALAARPGLSRLASPGSNPPVGTALSGQNHPSGPSGPAFSC